MNLNDLGIIVVVSVLLSLGISLWSEPVYRKFRLSQLKRRRAQKRLDK